MKLDIREGAVEDLKEMGDQIQKQVRDRIEGLRDRPLEES
jgi:mRNA-degrading endonuclease RelE of RelBE toxin-antitoxin system